MRCRHYERKPGGSKLLWKEHLNKGTRYNRAFRKAWRGFGRLSGAIHLCGEVASVTAEEAARFSEAVAFLRAVEDLKTIMMQDVSISKEVMKNG